MEAGPLSITEKDASLSVRNEARSQAPASRGRGAGFRWFHAGALLMALLPGISCGPPPPPEPAPLASVSLRAPFENFQAAYPNEPLGFRGFRWETPQDEMGALAVFHVDPQEGIAWYAKPGEPLRLGAIEADRLFYGVARGGRLVAGLIGFSEDRYDEVSSYLRETLGPPLCQLRGSRIATWDGDVALVKLFPDKVVVVYTPYLEELRQRGIHNPSYLQEIY